MRPSLPRIARQPVTAWALALLLLGASSLIHVCEYLTAGPPGRLHWSTGTAGPL